MTLHKEGTKTILLTLFLFVILNFASYYFIGFKCEQMIVAHVIMVLTAVFSFLIINFFRSPKRHFIVQDGAIIAPADGKVVVIEQVYEPEYLKCDAIQVSIFMSPLNVHINWYPIAGLIKYYRHHSGKYMKAFLPKSSTENERSTVVLENSKGTQILVRQVAGAVARRIVCYAKEGEQIKQSTQMGFIKFGSRVDMYLPVGTQIDAKLQDKTTGGQTIIGWLK